MLMIMPKPSIINVGIMTLVIHALTGVVNIVDIVVNLVEIVRTLLVNVQFQEVDMENKMVDFHVEDIHVVLKKLELKILEIVSKRKDGLQNVENVCLLHLISKLEMYLFIMKEVAILMMLMLSLLPKLDLIQKLLAIVVSKLILIIII